VTAPARAQTWDAVVVGSGITGGWAAKQLTEAGLQTLVLEAGRPVDPAKDYVEHVRPWQLRHRGGLALDQRDDQSIQKTCTALDGYTSKFFVNDRDNPYRCDDAKPFRWIRGRQVGGRSIIWGRQSYRWGPQDFEANARDGVGVDWPIRYEDLAPFYDQVEEFAGISGQEEGLAQLPDGRFLPPMAMHCPELAVRDAMSRKFGRARVLTIGRTAILTRNHRGRLACHYCGPCARGCMTRSYFSSLNATLPAADATRRLTLRPNSVVESVLFDPAQGRAAGVRVVDGVSGEALEFRAKLVFLCASALESVRILLNSRSERFPQGLGNSSGTLGRFVMDHTMGGGAVGTIPGHQDQKHFSQRPNGIYVPRFRNVTEKTDRFLRGYGFQGGAFRERWERGVALRGFGADLKRSLREDGPWRMTLYGFGECLPRAENRVEIDPALKDRWGIPALRIDVGWGDNERAMLKDMTATAVEILEAAGAKDITPFLEDNPPGLTIHEMGGARMGRDPRTSVLNGWCQAHDVPNLYVTDGAAMASTACQNPSLTYMALTARACSHAVGQLG
jgi:glucoside 3-dehydrogenase (cytochrome c) catalytic subunit